MHYIYVKPDQYEKQKWNKHAKKRVDVCVFMSVCFVLCVVWTSMEFRDVCDVCVHAEWSVSLG